MYFRIILPKNINIDKGMVIKKIYVFLNPKEIY